MYKYYLGGLAALFVILALAWAMPVCAAENASSDEATHSEMSVNDYLVSAPLSDAAEKHPEVVVLVVSVPLTLGAWVIGTEAGRKIRGNSRCF